MAKVLIIKLGYSETLDPRVGEVSSLGDVLRSTVILHLFKKEQVTWLVDKKAYLLLDGNKYIDRVLVYNLSSVLQLQSEKFDTVINLEKGPGICALADSIKAWRRYGFRFDENTGESQIYDKSEHVFQICKDITIKKHHIDRWQQAIMEMVGGKWDKEEYVLGYKPKSKLKYDVGLNWQVGTKWPNKAWPREYWDRLGELLEGKFSYSMQQGENDLREYIEWVNSCRLLVTADSLGQHIALALKRNVLILYGPTNPNETYLYNRGKELLAEVDYNCVPCLKNKCFRKISCMHYITPERVAREVSLFFNRKKRSSK